MARIVLLLMLEVFVFLPLQAEPAPSDDLKSLLNRALRVLKTILDWPQTFTVTTAALRRYYGEIARRGSEGSPLTLKRPNRALAAIARSPNPKR